jgi:hypothetical protein
VVKSWRSPNRGLDEDDSLSPFGDTFSHVTPTLTSSSAMCWRQSEHIRDSRSAYRFKNDHHFVIARKPHPSTA